MPADNLVRFEDRRRTRRSDAPAPREPIPERLFCVLIGSLIGAFGLGLAALCLTLGTVASRIVGLLPAILLGFIGVFGVSWVVQGLRGRSRHEGVFYGLLRRLGGLGPRPWSLAAPGLALAAVLVAALTDDRQALETALGILVAWSVLMAHVGVHELGHCCAARIAGLRVARVLVGPAELSRSDGRWQLELSRDWWSILGGWVRLEADGEAIPPRALLGFAVGGPLATSCLLSGFLVASPIPIAKLFLASTRGLQAEAFSLGVMIGIGMLLFTLLPSRSSALGPPSDGFQILSALRQLVRSRRTGQTSQP